MIRLTFVSDTQRSAPREYDTDDLAEAMIEYANRSFRLRPDEKGPASNRGPDTWVIAFIVERDGERLPHEEVVRTFKHISNLENLRGDLRGDRS